jgi:transcriptional regulator with GAF, ATPase, and Fis domain
MSLAAAADHSHAPDSPEHELEGWASRVHALSSQLNQLTGEAIVARIARELPRIGHTCGSDLCTLIEFDQLGIACAHHTWTPAGARLSHPELDAEHMPWMLQCLSHGKHVTIRRADVPIGAWRDRSSLQKLGLQSVLAIPAAVEGHVVCALVVAGFDDRSWDQPLVDRLRLIAGVLASALQRRGDESALQAHAAEIDRQQGRDESDMMHMREAVKTCTDFHEIVGDSDLLRQALERVRQVAPVNSTVLLLGETGTGKELFARAVHERSPRRNRPFVCVNCAALPPTLIESELFGHEKGAFTGAVSMRQGRFEVADGGTIFLDEIGDLPAEVQVKLLRVLQEREFERLGSSRSRRIDVRVVAATHRDLRAAVAEGRFRSDLYYRLSVFPIHLPALRERRKDIPDLVWHVVHRRQRGLGRRIIQIPRSVMERLQAHDWPGNIRELENVVERAMIRSSGGTLQLDDESTDYASALRAASSITLGDVQRAHIEAVLRECNWRINGTQNAAERLGVHPNTLRFRMRKLGIVRPAREQGSSHASSAS